MIDLGAFDGLTGEAWAANIFGQVSGRSNTSGNPDTPHPHAFLWTAQDDMVDLGTLGGSESLVTDVGAQR
jgi:probable HAF family extracellular repeat protein